MVPGKAHSFSHEPGLEIWSVWRKGAMLKWFKEVETIPLPWYKQKGGTKMFPIWNLRAGPRVPDRVLQRSSRLYISLSETWVSIVWVKPWESYMIATHTPEPKIGFHTWNRFLCWGWRLIAYLLLTRLASMFACNSGASRQFDTYLMDKGVMQILEGKGINLTKDIGQEENITQFWLSRS